jgi:ribosome maturation protein Sdo1
MSDIRELNEWAREDLKRKAIEWIKKERAHHPEYTRERAMQELGLLIDFITDVYLEDKL